MITIDLTGVATALRILNVCLFFDVGFFLLQFSQLSGNHLTAVVGLENLENLQELKVREFRVEFLSLTLRTTIASPQQPHEIESLAFDKADGIERSFLVVVIC